MVVVALPFFSLLFFELPKSGEIGGRSILPGCFQVSTHQALGN
jgi:hypothetical protein